MDVFVSWRDITYEPVGSAGAGGIGKVSVALAISSPNEGVLLAVKAFAPLLDLSGPIGATIKARLEEMIVIKTDDRRQTAALLSSSW
jgi:hypothetical protein